MSALDQIIPNADGLLAAIDAGCTNRHSYIHGPAHWRAVAWTGLQLLPETPAAEPAVVLLFAMFHDVMRLDDGSDPQHGPRAAVFAESLHGQHFTLPEPSLRRLVRACHDHTTGGRTDDPTVAVCWDADRLNLWRIGVRPHEKYLSTDVARRNDVIEAASRLEGQKLGWGTIVEGYRRIGRS